MKTENKLTDQKKAQAEMVNADINETFAKLLDEGVPPKIILGAAAGAMANLLRDEFGPAIVPIWFERMGKEAENMMGGN